MSWLIRLANVFQREKLHRDLDDELQFHIEARTEELVRRGMTAEEAAREARRQFGNPLSLRELSSDAKLFPWLESVLQDARFGLRMLRKDRAVTIAALLSLSLAIGACTAAFSLTDALILRPLPVLDPGSLVALSYPVPGSPTGEDGYVEDGLYKTLREVARNRVDLFGYMGQAGLQRVTIGGSHEEEAVRINMISGDAFRILGIQPAAGRLLTAGDDPENGDHAVAVLSHAFWTRRFGASPAALGQTFTFSDKQYEVVGIAAKDFTGLEPGYLTDVWVSRRREMTARGNFFSGWSQVWGRLQPGVAMEHAQQLLGATFSNYRRDHRGDYAASGLPPDRLENFVHAPLHLTSAAHGGDSLFRMQFQRPLWILAAVVGLVLLIACSNVANLFLARAAAREHEMAMRVSIGAGRARLLQQVLIESGMLAVAACVLGVLFASFAENDIVSRIAPASFPAYLDLRFDHRVLAFVVILGLVTTILFGLTPALRASAVSPNEALKTGSTKQSAKTGVLRPLVAAQVGFSFTVLFLAGLLLLTFQKLTNLNLGFSKDGVALYTIQARGLKPGDQALAVEQQLLERVRQFPGVQGASLSALSLVSGPYAPMMIRPIRINGIDQPSVRPDYLPVSPGFFDTLRIRMIDGRDFAASDKDRDTSTVVIVNETFARQFFHGENPVGKEFEQMDRDGRFVSREIVGLVGDAKYNNLREPAAPIVYEPIQGPGGTLEVRNAGDPLRMAATLRQEIQRVDPTLRVTNITLQSTQIDNTIVSERLLAILAGFFAIVALVLAAVGLYGVLSYSVVRRTQEIGIRIALGAPQLRVVRLVVGDVGVMLGAGVAAGMLGGLALSRLVTKLLFEVKPSDAWSLIPPLVCLLAASALAVLPPAIRAVRVDPMVALRYE